ncbi:DUF7662 domain-containing protein [Phenylobacterium sp. VNQ135]|uniref:DUF7662 domain-containing protein n=1 Tax=Phenylobacterium sp. VNQ135 TaxID=3400922 RepID=UPI003C0F38BA
MSKYKPLSDRLSGHDAPEWRASFAELEEVLGFPLPKAARSGGTWWGDDKRTWRDHGWRADDIDHTGGYVTFKRDGHITAAVAESVVGMDESRAEAPAEHGATAPPLPPGQAVAMGAMPRATLGKMRRAGAAAPIVAGVAVLAGVAALLARNIRRRRAA